MQCSLHVFLCLLLPDRIQRVRKATTHTHGSARESKSRETWRVKPSRLSPIIGINLSHLPLIITSSRSREETGGVSPCHLTRDDETTNHSTIYISHADHPTQVHQLNYHQGNRRWVRWCNHTHKDWSINHRWLMK